MLWVKLSADRKGHHLCEGLDEGRVSKIGHLIAYEKVFFQINKVHLLQLMYFFQINKVHLLQLISITYIRQCV